MLLGPNKEAEIAEALTRIIREGPGLAALRGLIGIVFVASTTR